MLSRHVTLATNLVACHDDAVGCLVYGYNDIFIMEVRQEKKCFAKNPTSINKLTTFPPIGLADHDFVYIELGMWLRRVRETTRKIMRYDNTNREHIRTD